MKQYVDKAAIVAEIERRMKEIRIGLMEGLLHGYERAYATAQYSAFNSLITFLEILKVKEVQNIPVPDNETALFGANWYRNNVWHDRRETPEYKEEKNNQILVYGQNSAGRGCHVCSMIADGVIYSPMTHKEYKWGECHFTQWAYIEDLLPTEGYKE